MSDENQSKHVNVAPGCGCAGCMTTIVSCIILWALIFGWTWNGAHHSISCGCDKGVEVR
jgi:hypothetical protein